MWRALGDTLPQAVGVALSPVPVILVILMLVSARGRSNAVAFALGWLAGAAVLVVVAASLADGADVASNDGGGIGQLVLGGLFAVLAVRAWRTRPEAGAEPPPSPLFEAVDSFTPLKSAGLGVLGAVANPKNLPLLISSGIAIAQSGIGTTGSVAAAGAFALVASASVLLPVLAVLLAGDRSTAPLQSLKAWLLANNPTIMLILFVVLAAKMLGAGLQALA